MFRGPTRTGTDRPGRLSPSGGNDRQDAPKLRSCSTSTTGLEERWRLARLPGVPAKKFSVRRCDCGHPRIGDGAHEGEKLGIESVIVDAIFERFDDGRDSVGPGDEFLGPRCHSRGNSRCLVEIGEGADDEPGM